MKSLKCQKRPVLDFQSPNFSLKKDILTKTYKILHNDFTMTNLLVIFLIDK